MNGFIHFPRIGLYKPFLRRQEAEVEILRRDENIVLGDNIDYSRHVFFDLNYCVD